MGEKDLIVKAKEEQSPIKSAFANFITGITRIFTEREDLFNSLDEIGIAWSESTVKLIKRKGKIKDKDIFALQELLGEINKNRERRISEIQKEFSVNLKKICDAEINAKNLAVRSVRKDMALKKKELRYKYGFIKGSKEFKRNREHYKFEEKLRQKEKYFLDLANIPALEKIALEANVRFNCETELLIDVLRELFKNTRSQKIKHIISDSIESINKSVTQKRINE